MPKLNYSTTKKISLRYFSNINDEYELTILLFLSTNLILYASISFSAPRVYLLINREFIRKMFDFIFILRYITRLQKRTKRLNVNLRRCFSRSIPSYCRKFSILPLEVL